MRHRVLRRAWMMMAMAVVLATAARAAQDTFIESDDYKEGEEVVGKFLTDDDYRIMGEDIERNDEEFDWGWVKGEIKRGKVRRFDFDLGSYRTIAIPPVINAHVGLMPDEIPQQIHDLLGQAVEQLGLEVTEGEADLTLGTALVDYKKDSTFIFVGNIKPFIELELRLRDNRAGEDLVLIRNQVHGDDAETAALNFAEELIRFLK